MNVPIVDWPFGKGYYPYAWQVPVDVLCANQTMERWCERASFGMNGQQLLKKCHDMAAYS
jgi:hypothetical protein